MLAGLTQASQATRVKGRLVEVLGRFVGSVDILRWRLAKPNIAQLFKALSNRTYLLF